MVEKSKKIKGYKKCLIHKKTDKSSKTILRAVKNPGSPVAKDWNRKIIGLDLDDLKKIDNVVGIAWGEKKVDAIRGCLNDGYLDVLITDSYTAKLLAKNDKENYDMRALLLEGKEDIHLKEIDRPVCSPEGAILKVKACGICGGDVRTYFNGFRMKTDNKIMGHEITGEVIEVGEKHTKYKIGDRLSLAAEIHCYECYYCKNEKQFLCENLKILGKHVAGGFAEYFHLTEEVIKGGIVNYIPENLDYIEAALSEPMCSVVYTQEDLGISEGMSVLIIGAGPMGCMHAEIAKKRGARVIVSQRSSTRLELAKKVLPEVDWFIHSEEEDVKEKVMEITEGLGVDVVIVAAPSPPAIEDAVNYIKKDGVIDIFGGVPRDKSTLKFDSNKIHYDTLKIKGSFSYHPGTHKEVLDMLATNRLDPHKFITVLPMEDIDRGISGIKAGKFLKVILTM